MVDNDQRIIHANLELPKALVHKSHPFRDEANHTKLLDYLQCRFFFFKSNVDSRRERFAQIDRDVAAWLQMSDDDKKKATQHKHTGQSQSTEVSLPLTWVHLDDMMTYYAQTFAPNRGMFYQTAKPDQKDTAQALVDIMNRDALYSGYYRQLLRAIFAINKYNVGGLVMEWDTDYGPQMTTDDSGNVSVTQIPIHSGNCIEALDMYNFWYDESVDPSMLHKDGEWFSYAKIRSHYWLKNQCLKGRFYNCESLFQEFHQGDIGTNPNYVDPPSYSRIRHDESNGQSWTSILSGVDGSYTAFGYELMTMYIRLNPNDFGLVAGSAAQRKARNRYEIWRFTIANNSKIIETKFCDNIHDNLPVYIGVVADDNMREQSKGPAEILNPMQQFSSFLLNAHVKTNRKNLYGTTFYDPTMVDYDKVPAGEVAARVPVKPAGYGKDIRTMVFHDNHALDSKQTLGDLQGMMDLVNQFFPTQSLPSQIASIDRAVTNQVAAVQQGANRRQQKSARIIDDTMLRPMRVGMYYNIIQYISEATGVQDFYQNKSDNGSIEQLQNINLLDVIGQGLKAIDRQAMETQVQQLMFSLIQAPAVGQQFDLVKLVDFWASLMDIEVDMEDFRAPPPPQPGQPGATQAGAGGNPIQPATNPASVTAPIYG